jgi:hypothetical protein
VPVGSAQLRRGRWSLQVLAGSVLLLGAVALVAAVDPHTRGRYPVCPWHAMTGTWCPGCGGLRAVHDLTHGHLVTAAGENLLVVALVPVLAIWWLVTRIRSGRTGGGLVLGPRATMVLVVAAVAFTAVRNLPFGAALAP